MKIKRIYSVFKSHKIKAIHETNHLYTCEFFCS